MNARDDARRLLAAAQRDLAAARGMEADREAFYDEVFGFHVQQTAEKALKAWLIGLSVTFPRTHDISLLLRLLEDAGQDCEAFYDLLEYSAFSVQFRYEAFEDDAPVDRADALRQLEALMTRVRRAV